MLVLKYLENSFDSLSFRVKVELFLFPLIVIVLLVFFISEENNQEKSVRPIFNNIDISKIKMEKPIVDILKDIEAYSLKNKITLHSIKNSDSSIIIEIFSNTKKRVSFLKYLEDYNNFSKIDSLEIIDDRLIVEVWFKKFYKKDNIDLEKDIQSLNNFNKQKKFIVKAIVDKRAFINNRWMKIDQMLGSFKIYKIDNNRVFLKNSYKTLILKLYKNENL